LNKNSEEALKGGVEKAKKEKEPEGITEVAQEGLSNPFSNISVQLAQLVHTAPRVRIGGNDPWQDFFRNNQQLK